MRLKLIKSTPIRSKKKGDKRMNGFNPEGWNEEAKKICYTNAEITEAKNTSSVLEAKVLMCDAGHNLVVDLGSMKGIIPRDEGAIGISDGSTRDIALITRVGKTVCFTVEDIEPDRLGNPYAKLSRKRAQELCRKQIAEHNRPGDIINAKVTHLESFGAFCDIGCGNIALLPIDSISVSRISHPKDRFYTGENIRAVIKNIAPDGKITLSHKELLGTWEEMQSFSPQGRPLTELYAVWKTTVFLLKSPLILRVLQSQEQMLYLVSRQAFISRVSFPKK